MASLKFADKVYLNKPRTQFWYDGWAILRGRTYWFNQIKKTSDGNVALSDEVETAIYGGYKIRKHNKQYYHLFVKCKDSNTIYQVFVYNKDISLKEDKSIIEKEWKELQEKIKALMNIKDDDYEKIDMKDLE